MTAKENLEKLLDEKSSHGRNLTFAIDANDGLEISRIKQREKTIDSDIFAAQVLALKAEIAEVEAQLLVDGQNIVKAQELSRETDFLVASQNTILRGEIERLSGDAMAKLVGIKTAERQRNSTGARLSKLREKLSELLEKTTGL
jgi:hypothetical protein